MYKHRVLAKQTIPEIRGSYQSKLDNLITERKKLYSYLRGTKKPEYAYQTSHIKRMIKEASDEIRDVRHKLKLCDECFSDCERIVRNISLLERKIEPDRNLSRGSSR